MSAYPTCDEMIQRARECQEKLKDDPGMDAINNWTLKNTKKDQNLYIMDNPLEWLTGMIKNFD